MEIDQAWLIEQTWDQVINLNASLCTAQKFDCKLMPKADKAQALWTKNHTRSMSLLDALELCRRCNDFRPFLFNCSNTFTALGGDLVEGWATQLSSIEGHMLRQTTTHYVDGRVRRKELVDLLKFLQRRPLKPVQRKSKQETPAPPSLEQVRAHQVA